MRWSKFRNALDEKPTQRRDGQIVQAFANGNYLPIQWTAIGTKVLSYFGIIFVASDALQLGEPGDSCRINVTPFSAQKIVDLLGLALLTDKIVDLVHEQALVTIPPKTDESSMRAGRGGHLETMETHNARVRVAIGERNGLTSTVGKHWILHDKLLNRPKWGVNYGWHHKKALYKGKGGHKMWQPIGAKHNWSHVDYSQVLVPMNRVMLVNGEEMLVEDVMVHPELSMLVSYDGPMEVTRHPDVQEPVGGVKVSRI